MAKRASPKRKAAETDGLLQAVKFAAMGCNDVGMPYQTHLVVKHHWVVGHNGELMAAHPITEDLAAFPHGKTLLTALQRAPGAVNITQNEDHSLRVSSGRLRSTVPCELELPMPTAGDVATLPGEPMADGGEALRRALALVCRITTENAARVLESSFVLDRNTLRVSNGVIAVEFRLPYILTPTPIVVPRFFAARLVETDKRMARVGCSERSFTVHFEDRAMLRTQLYTEKPIDFSPIWPKAAPTKAPISEHFFPGLATVLAFGSDVVTIGEGGITAPKAEFAVNIGIEAPRTLNGKLLSYLADYVTDADFNGRIGAYLTGKDCRAVVAYWTKDS